MEGILFAIVFRVKILRKRRKKSWKNVLKMTGVLRQKETIKYNRS